MRGEPPKGGGEGRDDELSMGQSRLLSAEEAAASLNCLGSFAKNYLPILFNTISSSSQVKQRREEVGKDQGDEGRKNKGGGRRLACTTRGVETRKVGSREGGKGSRGGDGRGEERRRG
eukprot:748789-Hanusia_phi.AAC.1